MTRWQKIKKWAIEHQEAIAVAGVVVGTVAFVAAIVKLDSKERAIRLAEHNEWADTMNAWIEEERANGRVIYPIIPGEFLVAPEDLPIEVISK